MTLTTPTLQHFYKALSDPFLHVDSNGQILGNNTASVELIEGKSTSESINKSIFEIIPTISFLQWKDVFNKVKQDQFYQTDGEILGPEQKLSRADFVIVSAESDTCLILIKRKDAPQGRPSPIVDSNKPLEILELISITLDHSQSLIFWVKEDASLHYYNQAVLSVLGYSQKDLKDKKFTDLNPNLDPEGFKEYWQEIKTKGDLNTEHLFYKKDGTSFDVEANIFYVPAQEADYCCIFMRNISARKNKERELEAAFLQINKLKNRLQEEKSYFKAEVAENYSFNNIISRSEAYKPVLQKIAQVAEADSTVLITGETGTGKELLARAIHGLSPREEENLVKVNCAALPGQLIESELFGHTKGAFTGAIADKQGKFEIADGGSLFLDEIGELPLELQSKLLRALQEGEIERVGDPYPIKVNVRIIAATNRNLQEMVAKKQFREDLFYRLNVFPIHNIPLRERREDIPLLAQHFLKKYARKNGKPITQITQSAIKALAKYDFPGNIRELENLIERAVIISKGQTLKLKAVIPNNKSKIKKKGFPTLEELQKQHIIKALQKTRGTITGKNGAAELLGMNGKTLASRMYKLGIDRFDFLE
ncbi:MAG: hypothetical protein Sapg2KO_31060 [Saprospiraceae bacterium]